MSKKTKSPCLPACNLNYQYHLTFWTVEADPKADAGVTKAKLARIFQDCGNIDKCHVAREISETGYHHHHVVCRFANKQRLKKLISDVQKGMHYSKPGGKKISVRVFHPFKGSQEDYKKLMSYITEKKFKDANPDPDGALEVLPPPCRYCGLTKCVVKPLSYFYPKKGMVKSIYSCEKNKYLWVHFFDDIMNGNCECKSCDAPSDKEAASGKIAWRLRR